MKYIIPLIAILITFQSAGATSWTKNDFASGYELKIQKEGAIHYITLPKEIYTTAVQSSLADLRVFNGEEHALSHVLKLDTSVPTRITREISLPFSPLFDIDLSGTVRQTEVRILKGKEANEKGAAISLTKTEREKQEETRKMKGYLIDTQSVTVIPYHIRFDISSENDYIDSLYIESSDDLTHWTHLGTSTIARLTYQGHMIRKNFDFRINRERKYHRVIWKNGYQEIIIQQISALTVTGEEPQKRNWVNLLGKNITDEKSPDITILEFDSMGFFPVDTLRLSFPEENTIIQATIKSSSNPAGQWHKQATGVFYKIKAEGNILQNDTVSIPRTTNRYWRLEIPADQDYSPGALPNLNLGWLSHKLYFISHGRGPYILAFGNGAMPVKKNSSDSALETLLMEAEKQKSIISPAQILDEIELGGPDALLLPPPPTQWKKWLIWAVLIFGVLVIGSMALNLYRQMKKDSF